MILCGIDECGDEFEIERFEIGSDLDDDWLSIWKSKKVSEASEIFPEAQRFFWEDRRKWAHYIACGISPFED